jgi:hypothetical protein
MSQLTPLATSVNDICVAALKECGALGQGQSPTGEEIDDAWTRFQWMLQEWGEDSLLVYRNRTITIQSVDLDALPIDPDQGSPERPVHYMPVGPGAGTMGGFETGPDNTSVSPTQAKSAAPRRLTRVFLRQTSTSAGLPIDYALTAMESMADYAKIMLKGMISFPGMYFYDPAWPLGRLFLYPQPNSHLYGIGIVMRDQLPIQFVTDADTLELPFQYFNAFYLNLAMRLRPHYGMRTYPGDLLPDLAKGARAAIKNTSVQIAQLDVPPGLTRPGLYNIFSDRSY